MSVEGRVATRLLSGVAPLWARIGSHPFVTSAADGSLDPRAFDRWLVEDHAFVVGFRRFLVELSGLAPGPEARDVLAGALEPLDSELELFRSVAASRGLDLDVEPSLVTVGYTSYVLASLLEGYAAGLTVLYGAEKAYFDAWRSVRETADATSPYRAFIENWSSDEFGAWVDRVARLLDEEVEEPTSAMTHTFVLTVRFELRFWDAVYEGAG